MDSNSTQLGDTITVLGAGYVGLTTAALFANIGLKVYAIEPNPERLRIIKSGRSFFYEAGLDTLINKALESGQLIPTASYDEAIPNSRVVFSCVGTPDNEDGSSNLEYVFNAANSTAKLAKPGTIFVQKSTVPVGTARSVIKLFNDCNANLQYVSNPEFLREGTAIKDTLFFDRVVIGGESHPAQIIEALYRQLESNRKHIIEQISLEAGHEDGIYIKASLESAELTKVTSNAFLALKISFANTVAQLADVVGADVTEVMNAVGADKRIGRSFLNAGRGYGGGCFPKDVSGLIASSEQFGVDFGIMKEAQLVNDSMPGYIINKTIKEFGIDFKGMNVAVLGLAFKAGTSDTRKSPGVAICNLLIRLGAEVSAYDPQANSEAAELIDNRVVLYDSIETATKFATVVIIATEWPEFKYIDRKNLVDRYVVDAVNILDKQDIQAIGRGYIGVGR